MNWFKMGLAGIGMIFAASSAQAGTIANSEINFDAGNVFIDASGGSAVSTAIGPYGGNDQKIDGNVEFNLDNIVYWWKRKRTGWFTYQTSTEARNEAAQAWDLSVSYEGKTVDLGGFSSAVGSKTFTTGAFDGLTAGGEWILTANSDYDPQAKRMIQFDLSGSFNVAAVSTSSGGTSSGGTSSGGTSSGGTSSGGTSSGGGSVPVPASALFVLLGLAGIGAASRRNEKAKA